MTILIIEDEASLARQLRRMLVDLFADAAVLPSLPSVRESVAFFRSGQKVDLILADIYLNDGLSFEIFEQIACPAPIIFCTAYDQYAIKAFELDSVDYLLKPIRQEGLQKAVEKYKRLFAQPASTEKVSESIQRIGEKLLNQKTYRQGFLLTHKGRLVPVATDEISYFLTDYGMIKCVTYDQRIFPLEMSLDALSEELDPAQFYRANRQYLVSRGAIVDVEFYFNGRLCLNTRPKASEPVIISKAKATEFRNWLSNSTIE